MVASITLKRIAFLKQIVWRQLSAGIVLFLCVAVKAQEVPKLIDQQKQQIQSSAKDAAPAILEEYNLIISKYDITTKKGRKDFDTKITEADRVKLEALYKRMSKKQQSEQAVRFLRKLPPLPVVVPTDKQLEEWENEKNYSVWLDGRKVNNDVLRDYSNTDFSRFDITKFSKNNSKNAYRINLITKEYYQEYFQQSPVDKDKNVLFVKELHQ